MPRDRYGSSQRRRKFGAGAAVLLFLALIAPADAADGKKEVTVDQLVDYFETIVFGSEHGPRYAATEIAKWTNPVTFTFQGDVSTQHRDFVRIHLQTLSNLTRLRFDEVDADKPNIGITLFFAPRNEMSKIPVPHEHRGAVEEAAQSANCFFFSWKKPPSRIIKTIVVADIGKDPAILNSCLLEELAQCLGLPNDSDTLRPSVFSDSDRLYELAPQDRILLYTLYDPRMTPGLRKADALKVARKIITELARPAEPSTSRGPNG